MPLSSSYSEAVVLGLAFGGIGVIGAWALEGCKVGTSSSLAIFLSCSLIPIIAKRALPCVEKYCQEQNYSAETRLLLERVSIIAAYPTAISATRIFYNIDFLQPAYALLTGGVIVLPMTALSVLATTGLHS